MRAFAYPLGFVVALISVLGYMAHAYGDAADGEAAPIFGIRLPPLWPPPILRCGRPHQCSVEREKLKKMGVDRWFGDSLNSRTESPLTRRCSRPVLRATCLPKPTTLCSPVTHHHPDVKN